MRKIDQLLLKYGESHKNKTNKLIHWLCVPAIFFSIVGMVWSIPNGPLNYFNITLLNWATISLFLVLIYYLSISIFLSFGMALFAFTCIYLSYTIELIFPGKLWLISLIIFVVAWIFQFIGHEIEGKKPSFLEDIQFLLIGPAWLMHFIYKKLNITY
jgi:uncharacterized membrane protein YGL010W